jgi:hypothetical protein
MHTGPRALALLLPLGALLAPATADAWPRRNTVRLGPVVGAFVRYSAVVPGDGAEAPSSVRASLSHDGGEETVELVESDAWLHAVVAVEALPASSATLRLALYDTAAGELVAFAGTLGADGQVALSREDDGKSCSEKEPCSSTGPDVELLGASLYAAAKGYELGLELAGADAHDVASATLLLSETVTTDKETCTATDKEGTCLSWGSVTVLAETKAEAAFDDIGAVWSADLSLAPEGAVDAKLSTYDARGKKLSKSRSTLSEPWSDGDAGLGAIGVDGDALSSVGVLRRAYGQGKYGLELDQLHVVSEGWEAGDTLPVEASVQLDDGTTLLLAATSYQRRGRAEFLVEDFRFTVVHKSFQVQIDGATLTLDSADLSAEDLSRPVCAEGVCITIEVDEDLGTGTLSLTQYRWDDAFPSDGAKVEITAFTAEGKASDTLSAAVLYEEEVAVMFGAELGFQGDPAGTALSGSLRLLGAPDKKGKQKTLARGSFAGVLARDGAGAPGLSAADPDALDEAGTWASFEAAPLEPCGSDGLGYDEAPPPLLSVFGNGQGTKNAASTASTKPQLL